MRKPDPAKQQLAMLSLEIETIRASGQQRVRRELTVLGGDIGERASLAQRIADLLALDPEGLGDHLRTWFDAGPFTTKRVIVGVTSPQVRTAVMHHPEATSDELAALEDAKESRNKALAEDALARVIPELRGIASLTQSDKSRLTDLEKQLQGIKKNGG